MTPKTCWATNTAASRWTPGCCIEAHDRAALERLLRYCARPPFSMERLRKEGSKLVYRCGKQRSEPTSDKRGAKVDAAAPHTAGTDRPHRRAGSPPRTHRHRYFGVSAPNSPLRAAVTALATPAQAAPVLGASISTGSARLGVVPMSSALPSQERAGAAQACSALPVGGADRPHLRGVPPLVSAVWRAYAHHRVHYAQR